VKELTSPPIAEGRTAEIYLWDEGHVLKLYRNWCPSDWVEYEATVASAIHAAGIPSPATGEILEVNGRRGLIYERLEGISMLQDMNARPWRLIEHARSLADLQVQINQKTIRGLPSYKDRLRYDIGKTSQLSLDLREKAFAALDILPVGENVCHGDFHPGNVILTDTGPVVIDWMTVCSGSPWTDVARTSLVLSIGPKGAEKMVSPIIRMAITLYRWVYLHHYHALAPDTKKETKHWIPVVAAARLNENISPERDALIKMVKEGLNG
jgi:Ser/Thr protein kinase RdoA (MazF antagonist)